jgi:hypothetical protein
MEPPFIEKIMCWLTTKIGKRRVAINNEGIWEMKELLGYSVVVSFAPRVREGTPSWYE